MTTSALSHAVQQLLVEVGPDAEGGGGDAATAQFDGVADQFVRVGEADVGEAVGEEERAGQPAVAEFGLGGRGEAAAGEPAFAERGGAAVAHRAEAQGDVALGGGVHADARGDGLDAVVVDNDGGAVVGRELTDAEGDRALDEVELLPGHRAAAIEDEGEVERLARGPGVARRFRDAQGQAEEAPAALGGQERAVEGGVEGDGGHGASWGESSVVSRVVG
ncbi:MAG: hypothetical protein U0232_26595 [Thermomicrobiales bacterium]